MGRAREFHRRRSVWLVAMPLVSFVLFSPSAMAQQGMSPEAIAPGSLDAPVGGLPQTGDPYNRTKWTVQAGDSITDTIVGATDDDLQGAQLADVVIKSSALGNFTVTG